MNHHAASLDTSSDVAKLVFAGPVGTGKTTAIHSVTDSEPISSEMALSEPAMGDKTTTTVALDFSAAILDDGTPLLVYGLPGQQRFSHMRPIVLEGAFGVVIVLDGSSPDVAEQCEYWLREIRAHQAGMPMVIGITHTDAVAEFSIGPVRSAIRRCGGPVPTFTFDARDREQVAHLVRALLVTMQ